MFMQISRKKLTFKKLGKMPLCNCCKERAPHIRGFCFPICWRCLAICSGIIICHVIYSLGGISKTSIFGMISSVILIGICFMDGFIQLKTSYESTNCKRAVFGLGAGFGCRYLLFVISELVNSFS